MYSCLRSAHSRPGFGVGLCRKMAMPELSCARPAAHNGQPFRAGFVAGSRWTVTLEDGVTPNVCSNSAYAWDRARQAMSPAAGGIPSASVTVNLC